MINKHSLIVKILIIALIIILKFFGIQHLYLNESPVVSSLLLYLFIATVFWREETVSNEAKIVIQILFISSVILQQKH